MALSPLEPPPRLTVVLADDHHLFREGLRHAGNTGEITVVASAEREEAVRLARALDSALLDDINMPVDGIRATEAITRGCPRTM